MYDIILVFGGHLMNKLEKTLIAEIKATLKDKFDYDAPEDIVMVEIPKDSANGDYSTNIAMRLTKILKRRPQDIAQEIKEGLASRLHIADTIEIANPGFINFRIKKSAIADIINTIMDEGDDYGTNDTGKGLKVLVEYVSANPTGILHLGHARGAAWGDSLCRILKKAGYDALREYYINDAGNQIDMLAISIKARYMQSFGLEAEIPKDGYEGKDIIKIAEDIKNERGDYFLHCDEEEAFEFFKHEGEKREMDRIRNDLEYYRCHFDSWISEKDIVKEGRVEDVVKRMEEKGLTYESEDALWFKSTEYGDDKDRVLRKSNGFYTYLTPDIANHIYKFERGYQKLVNLWGADHHGYIARLKAALEALGYPKDALEVDIIQMVRLIENGEEVKMSKRTGNAVTIRELCEDVGIDAARYFFISRALDSHLDFDLGLARSKSNDNPVFYIQYAYARICSVLRQAPAIQKQAEYTLLQSDKEIDLLKHLGDFTNAISDAAKTRQVNKMANYAYKLAQYFHSFYGAHKIIDAENKELTNERLALLEAVRITLKNTLDLLGVEAKEKM